jgi:hypothetical protein
MKKVSSFSKENKFYFLGLLVLVIVVFINLFPRGYVFGGGDSVQFINIKNGFPWLFFSWNGSTSLFYLIFYFLGWLGVSDTTQLSFYLGIFLIGSYASFDAFSRLIFLKTAGSLRMLSSLFYALNLFTLFVFTGNLGFSYFFFLYLFVPVLVGLFIKFLESGKFIIGACFLVFILLASPGFGNPAFALSFSLLFLLLTIFLIVFRYVVLNRSLFFNLIILVFLSFLINMFWILPMVPQMKGGVANLYSGNAVDLNWALQHSSSPIYLTLMLAHPTKEYFPYDFPYQVVMFLKKFFIFLSFLPAIFILTGTILLKKFKNTQEKKLFLALFAVLIALAMLLVKVGYPFREINNFIFHIWGLNTLRGVEKISIYIPFLLASMVLITANNFQKYKKWITWILILIVFIPLPFFVGKIQQNISYRFPSGSNFQKYRLSFLVKIPQEYYDIQAIINNNEEKSFIAILPKTKNDGSGISDFPKWRFYGDDITKYLYDKQLIGANNKNFFKGWYFAEDFDKDSSGKYEWIVKLLGMMNSRYIIFHKDATEKYVEMAEPKMRLLEKEGVINKIQENNYFILYSIPNKFFLSYISWQKVDISLESNASSISNNFEKIKENSRAADFKEVNPRRYEVATNGEANNIILAEPFDVNWKAYIIDVNGKQKEIQTHFLARGYANGWKIEKSTLKEKIIIEYFPTRLLFIGIIISGVTLIVIFGCVAHIKLYAKNTRNNKEN